MIDTTHLVEHLFRHRTGQITASLVRVLGFEYLDMIEDVIQDALLKALKTWPYNGTPQNPSAWITQVAKNRAIDVIRRDKSWLDRQPMVVQHINNITHQQNEPDIDQMSDEQLHLMFACCHPAISKNARVALTLKSVGGFSVAEIASAFLTRETTIAQRLVRAKRQLRERRIRLDLPTDEDLPDRLDSVLQVIYLLFNEGYGASTGNQLVRRDLCIEAIRLCQCLVAHPGCAKPTVHALMALLYLQSARLATRVDQAGDLILLSEQDRSVWDMGMIQRGAEHLRRAAVGDKLSSYHLEAEISACHTLSPNYADTDWQSILDCYNTLYQQNASNVVAINRAVALLHVQGAVAAQHVLDELVTNTAIKNYYPYHVTRAAIAEQLGQVNQQQDYLKQALQLAGNATVKRFLIRKLATLIPIAS